MRDHAGEILKEITAVALKTDRKQIMETENEIIGSAHIFCDGFGRSALIMRGFAMRLMQMGFSAAMVGDVTAPAFCRGDLLLVCSASGSSAALKSHVDKAAALGGRIALLTGRKKSLLSDCADSILVISAPDKDATGEKKQSVQPMAALFEQTAQIVCDVMVLDIMERLQIKEEDMHSRHANLE